MWLTVIVRARALCQFARDRNVSCNLGVRAEILHLNLVFTDIRDKKIAIFGSIGAPSIHSEALTCLQEQGQTDISCQPAATGMLGTNIRGVSYTRRPPFEFH